MGRWEILGCTAAAVGVLFVTTSAHAAEFYVDPAAGSASGDGSQQNPWQTLEQVVADGRFGAAIKAGDTVWLRSGYHGELSIDGGDYATPITIAAESGQSPRLRRASFRNTEGWVLSGVSISPSHAASYETGTIVDINDSSTNVVVKDSRVFSIEDASGWNADQWVNEASTGFEIGGTNAVVRNNTVRNVRFGISVDGTGALIEHNQIINFSADGLRGLGDDGVFQYNVVKNSYVGDDQDPNHDDGFQSWSVGNGGVGTGEVRRVVLRGNYFINSDDPNQPLKGTLQGIGCFDGFFVDWVVENNVVITNHWHGISFLGMRDSRIVNNTVIDNEDGQPGPPWIMVNPHKNGSVSENVTVRNNLATDFDLTGTSIVDDHNTVLDALDAYFVDPASFDLHLLPNAPAIDQGSAELAPALDIELIPRPQGQGIDLGAYEWHDPSVEPVDGGASGGGAGTAGSGSGGSAAGGSGQGGSGPDGGAEGGSAQGGSAPGTGGTKASGGSGVALDDTGDDSGCGCKLSGSRASASVFLLLASFLGLALRRRGVRLSASRRARAR